MNKINLPFRNFLAPVGLFLLLFLGFSAVALAQQPANDDCANATVITTCPFVIGGTTNGATLDTGAPNNATTCGTSVTAPGVWYSFEGNGNNTTVSTCPAGTDYDTKLSVYTGNCGGPYTCVAGNDDACPSFRSEVTFATTAGTTYLILVHGFGGATGNFTLTVDQCQAPPPAAITFCVDLTCLPLVQAPSVFGTFNGWNAGANPVTDPDGDGIYCADVVMPTGVQEYKFFNQIEGAEPLGANTACSNAFSNREITVVAGVPQTVTFGWASCTAVCMPPPGPNVTLCVDLSCLPLVQAPSVFGTFNGWNAGADPVTDPDNDGIYCASVFMNPGVQEYKFFNQIEGAEPIGPNTACTNAFSNREITVVAGPPQMATFGWASCTAICNPPPVPNVTLCVDLSCLPTVQAPSVFGTFNGWCANCDPVTDPDGDGIYCADVIMAPGVQEYKFFNQLEGAEPIGPNTACTNGNSNREITVVAGPPQAAPIVGWNSCTATCVGPVDVELCVDVSCLTGVNAVSVFGAFNGWCDGCDPLTDMGGGIFCKTITFPPNTTQEYKFVYNPYGPNKLEENFTDGTPSTVTCCNKMFTNRIVTVGITDFTESHGWNNGGGATCLIPPDLTITFDDPLISYNMSVFGGPAMCSTVGVDPVNPANSVMCSLKPVGAPVWAGAVVGGHGLQNPIPFGPGVTSMTMDVYSPEVGTGFLLKVEDKTTGGGIASEVLAFTTVANAWETLVFDFSMGTPPINLANTYDLVVVFADFGQVGDGQTFYSDNIMMCTLPIAGITCPPDVVASCTDAPPAAATDEASFLAQGGTVDNPCGGPLTVTASDDVFVDGCGTIITRTYTVSAVASSATCVQTISLLDTEAPTITCPPNQTLTCFESVPDPITNAADFIAAGGTISDNCTANLADFTVFSQGTTNGGDNCPGNGQIVTRTYYVLDACGNTTTCTQTFTYLESTQGPVITSVLPTCYKYCGSLANPAASDITYTVDCSFDATVTITGPQQIGPDNCPGTIYRYTYTVTDDCGRTSAPVTRDFIIGNDGPTIQCPSYSLLLECGDPNNTDYIAAHVANVSANTSCELGYTINHFPQNFNNITCNTSTVVTFVATDNCGRTATCTTVINISDNTAPVITSTYVDGVCNEAVCGSNLSFWYNNWKSKVLEGLSATDACDSNVNITVSGPNSPNQDCPDGTAETTVTWFANDNCGNAGEISYTFYVVPAQGPAPGAQIMGILATEDVETVENVTVSLTGNSLVETDETAADGIYAFDEVALGENYTVTPYLNENPLNGVSSFDLVLISKHILQSELLDSPYKIIAADINKSGAVTTLDIVELRKLILHIDDNFANNNSWRFIESAFVFPVPSNPFATVFPEAVYINGLTEDEQHDFVGVKVGDVNGSAAANAMAGAEDKNLVGDLVFNIADKQLKAGEKYEVTFEADNFKAIHGYQFSLDFDQNSLGFAGLRTGALSSLKESNFGLTLLDKGVITTSWTNPEAQSIAKSAEVFHVSFVAKADVLLSDVLHVSSQYTKAEAYNGNLDLMNVQFRFDDNKVAAKELRLYQNTPNPFVQETMIGFELPIASVATLTVYDVSGNLLQQLEGDFAKGYNTISLSNEALTPGLLYYQLTTNSGIATKKMMFSGN